jgi:hypothetical protein
MVFSSESRKECPPLPALADLGMIKERQEKIDRIVGRIRNGISEINRRYRSGPDLYFYRWLLAARREARDVRIFLQHDWNLEILYATLVAWDMNSRAATLEYFDEFRASLLSNVEELQRLEGLFSGRPLRQDAILTVLEKIYSNLHLMKTRGRLVSNQRHCTFFSLTSFCPWISAILFNSFTATTANLLASTWRWPR